MNENKEELILTKSTYETRLIAFVDILGWSEASKCKSEYSRLKFTIEKISDYARSFSPETKNILKNTPRIPAASIQEHASIEFSFFSDCFVVSTPVDYGYRIFDILKWASHEVLLPEGFLVRGGVTIGNLHHCKGTIFGPAMVKAVRLEEEAVYPRLLCGGEKLEHYLKQNSYNNVLIDFDSKWVVNIALGSLSAKDQLMEIIDCKIKKIENKIKLSEDEKKKRDKWKYQQQTLPKMYEALNIIY